MREGGEGGGRERGGGLGGGGGGGGEEGGGEGCNSICIVYPLIDITSPLRPWNFQWVLASNYYYYCYSV